MYCVKSMTLSDQRVLSTYITLITATTALVFHLFGPLISIDPNIEQEINNPKKYYWLFRIKLNALWPYCDKSFTPFCIKQCTTTIKHNS